MRICYIDESGTPEVPGTTDHFVLVGLSMPIGFWKEADAQVTQVLTRFGLENAEFHTAWLLRPYFEQSRIPNFSNLSTVERVREVRRYRTTELLKLQKTGGKRHSNAKKTYKHTAPYIHLTQIERRDAALAVAEAIGGCSECTIFAECINKIHFDPARTHRSVDEQAFEQVISRFQQYLARQPGNAPSSNYGILVHDNNQTVAKKHTDLMRKFHNSGTLWTQIYHIIETPLYVDSSLTRMVQMADLCSYALRRYVENGETDLFRAVFRRVDRYAQKAVGIRHFAGLQCQCEICAAHHRGVWVTPP